MERSGRFRSAADVFTRILIPAAAGITLSALIIGGNDEIESDLRLIAPARAAAGQTVPLRALLYAELDQPEGPRLITTDVGVELRRGGERVASGALQPSYGGTLEGSLVLPVALAAGTATLRAEARIADEIVSVERALEVVPAPDVPVAAVQSRALPPLQRFAPGPIRWEAGGEPPETFALRAQTAGGACVPELPCTLFVHVGEPPAELRALETPSATPAPQSLKPAPATSGAVALRVTTHGPEGELRIAAERDGQPLATRAFRLAVALGASALQELRRVQAAGARPTVGLQGDEPGGCIVDGFHEQRWAQTGQLAQCRGGEPLPFALRTPGLWRIQLRRDPFAVGSAAVATLYVRAPGEPDSELLVRLARSVLAHDAGDALAQAVAVAPEAYAASLNETAGYLLAALDRDLFDLPRAVSGYPRAVALREATRARVRKLALCALALCALSIGLIVAQRGFAAAGEAGRVMAQAGEEPGRVDRQRLRMTLRVLATVSSLLLAFAAIAAYVIARGSAP